MHRVHTSKGIKEKNCPICLFTRGKVLRTLERGPHFGNLGLNLDSCLAWALTPRKARLKELCISYSAAILTFSYFPNSFLHSPCRLLAEHHNLLSRVSGDQYYTLEGFPCPVTGSRMLVSRMTKDERVKKLPKNM